MKTILGLTYDPSGHMNQKSFKEFPSRLAKLGEDFKKNLLIKLDTEDYEDDEN